MGKAGGVAAQSSSPMNPWFIILFGFVFAGFGVLMGYFCYDSIRQWQAMQSWQEGWARILEASLESHTSRNENSTTTTYTVKARYQYMYKGRGYIGTRIGIGSGSDNIGSYHQDMAARLQEAQRSDAKVPCYINPDHPGEAVLDRSLRTPLLAIQGAFSLVFGGAGIAAMFWGVSSCRREAEAAALARLDPAAESEPWRLRRDWRTGVIRSKGRAGVIGLFLFAFFWNGISFPVSYLVLSDLFPDGLRWPQQEGWQPALLVLLFPLIGILLILFTLRALYRHLRTGTVTFHMTPVPGVLGGIVGGMIEVPRKLSLEDGARLELSCAVTYSNGENTKTKVEWTHDNNGVRDLTPEDPLRTVLPVLFSPPYDELQSEETFGGSGTAGWVLKATTADGELEESFDIPVYRTRASREDFVLDPQTCPEAGIHTPATAAEFEREGLFLEERAEGERIAFPRLRHPHLMLGQIAVNAGLWAGTIGLWIHAPLIFSLVCGFFALVFLIPILQQILERREVEMNAACLVLRGGWGGSRQTTLGWDEVQTVSVREDQLFFGTQYWAVDLKDTAGKKYPVACTLQRRRLADDIVRRIRQARESGAALDPTYEPKR